MTGLPRLPLAKKPIALAERIGRNVTPVTLSPEGLLSATVWLCVTPEQLGFRGSRFCFWRLS